MLKERIVGMLHLDPQPTPENTEMPIEGKKEALQPADKLQNDLKVIQSGKVLEGIGSIIKNATENPEYKKILTPEKINEIKNTALDALKTKSIPILKDLPFQAVQTALNTLNDKVAFTAPPVGATGDGTTNFTAPPVG